jgi:predicted secreted protein
MSIASAIVLFLVIWFMTFLIALPIRVETQGEAGTIVPGTHAGSPENHHLRKKVIITTVVSVVLWIIIGGTILSGVISVRDIDMFDRMGPASSALD